MDHPEVLRRMRADWNARAGEDANASVAFGRRGQQDDEFFATAADVVKVLERELKRLVARDRALEIGCGPGRLMRPMSRHFARIDGVDVSDQMILLARERLRAIPNAYPHHGSGSDLALFPSDTFDFVYSFAVFQHIPSRDVVFHYLREARRVLKPGGILRCQINGLPQHDHSYDTWSGVRIAPDEVTAFALENDLQLLALEDIWTQYMWITCRKMPAGWVRSLAGRSTGKVSVIRSISNALTGERVAPVSGPLAALSVWIQFLPGECGLNHLQVTADGRECRMIYIGPPEPDGVSQVNVWLPEGLRTGLVPVEVSWLGQPVSDLGWVRIMPASPAVPRISAVTDAVNLLSGTRIISRFVKVAMTEVPHAGEFHATVDGCDALDTAWFCTDPLGAGYEFNFRLPEAIATGPHQVRIALGRRTFAPVAIEVA